MSMYPTHPSYPPVSGPVIPRNSMRPPPRSNVGLIAAIAAASLMVVGAAGGAAAWAWAKRRAPVAFPVDPKVLPTQTTAITTQLIEATRETDPEVRRAYLAAELGSEMCRPGSANPARRIEEIGSKSPRVAKDLFLDSKSRDDTAKVLECGSMLSATLESPYQAAVSFEDDDGVKQNVAVGHFTFTTAPRGQAFTPYAFRGVTGFCRTSGESGSSSDTTCDERDYGAFRHDASWFFGTRTALEALAPSVRKPKEAPAARVAAMHEAASQTEGLPVVRIESNPKSAKDFFLAPCAYGAAHSAVAMSRFLEGCFPAKALDRTLESLESKLKAAAYEMDGDHQKAKAFHGNLVFVARDDRGAKDIERDVKDIVAEWAAHLEASSPKLIGDARDAAFTSREKKFGAVIDTYFTALEKAKVARKGRSVLVSFRENISADELAALDDADRSTRAKRVATAAILDAMQSRKPVPEAPLAVLVGEEWAHWIATAPSAARAPLSETECKKVQQRVAWFKSTDPAFASNADARAMLFQHRFMACSRPPEVDEAQRACLASFHTASDYARCAVASASEPPESAYGDRAKK